MNYVVLSILSFIENNIDGLLPRSWIRPKAFVFLAYYQFIVMIANLYHYDLCFSFDANFVSFDLLGMLCTL